MSRYNDKRNAEREEIREHDRRRQLEERVDKVHGGDIDRAIEAARLIERYTDEDREILYRIKAERELEAKREKAVLEGLSSVRQYEFHH